MRLLLLLLFFVIFVVIVIVVFFFCAFVCVVGRLEYSGRCCSSFATPGPNRGSRMPRPNGSSSLDFSPKGPST